MIRKTNRNCVKCSQKIDDDNWGEIILRRKIYGKKIEKRKVYCAECLTAAAEKVMKKIDYEEAGIKFGEF